VDRSLLRLDLNLLKALYILLEERNVTRAAARLYITQSAMSKALLRLREALNDPLLVRTPSGLVPTPRAERLAVGLKAAFEHLEDCVVPTAFEPAKATGRMRIAAPETFAMGVLPGVISRLHAAAPNLQIEALYLADDYLDLLANGSVDFVVYLDQPYPEGYVTHKLFSAAPVIWLRRDHPIADLQPITLEAICAYPKIAFHSPSIPLSELRDILQELERADLGREVLFETSHLLLTLVMLSQSDALMLAPDYLFRHPMFTDHIVSRTIEHIPLFDHLRIDLGLIQHERTVCSAPHQWLAAEMINAVSTELASSVAENETVP
jgi:DNA-binding transcriptional LysR family regulator